MEHADQPERNGKKVSVGAVMTAPRYESVWARSAIERALQEAQVPLTITGGVFYGQCMQNVLEELVEKGVEYAVTVDFDSIFTASHVTRLLSIIVQEKQIDAIAAVQPRRGHGTLLATNGKGEQLQWRGYPLKVTFAHFGLTVLDVQKLAITPKPWFQSIPNDEGSWNGGKLDDDTFFWKQWEKAGNSLFIDPGCRLGHLEEMISIYDRDMNLTRVYTKDWADIAESTVG